jgi:hypothetical protein
LIPPVSISINADVIALRGRGRRAGGLFDV